MEAAARIARLAGKQGGLGGGEIAGGVAVGIEEVPAAGRRSRRLCQPWAPREAWR